MAPRAGRWKTVWITGASSGIGLELAKLLDDTVPHVAISARSEDKLNQAQDSGKTLKAYPLDVTDAPSVDACVAEIENAAGPIDLAVLNAGAWQIMDIDELDLSAVRAGVEVNYMGVVNCLHAVLPGMMSRGAGHIAIVASVAGYRGLPRSAAYGPTKAALINLAETLKTELAPRGITISLVNPGFVDTPMTRDNPFPMPGILPADEAARRMLAGLERRRYEIVFPTGFGLVMKALRLMPNALFFWALRRFVYKRQD